mmetsp:Transcript_19658/g.56322  ORF Transcript_19658/g.56322 Transcript_19658/m.56322 type:complete len:121 (-) Transcript_19658:451-813(-)
MLGRAAVAAFVLVLSRSAAAMEPNMQVYLYEDLKSNGGEASAAFRELVEDNSTDPSDNSTTTDADDNATTTDADDNATTTTADETTTTTNARAPANIAAGMRASAVFAMVWAAVLPALRA